MADFYRNGNATIRRVDGGYVLIIVGNAGRRTVLLIRNDGGMIDASGEPIIASDIDMAAQYLPHVGGKDLIPLLRQAMLTPEATSVIKQRMIPNS